MKAAITETSTVTQPEQRIWIVTVKREDSEVYFTFRNKAQARAFAAAHDAGMPTVTVKGK